MTFTRPPGTEWRLPRRITRTNGKDAPLSRAGHVAVGGRSILTAKDPSSFFGKARPRSFSPFPGLSFREAPHGRRGTVNNPPPYSYKLSPIDTVSQRMFARFTKEFTRSLVVRVHSLLAAMSREFAENRVHPKMYFELTSVPWIALRRTWIRFALLINQTKIFRNFRKIQITRSQR